jgi:hypothetical protein
MYVVNNLIKMQVNYFIKKGRCRYVVNNFTQMQEYQQALPY